MRGSGDASVVVLEIWASLQFPKVIAQRLRRSFFMVHVHSPHIGLVPLVLLVQSTPSFLANVMDQFPASHACACVPFVDSCILHVSASALSRQPFETIPNANWCSPSIQFPFQLISKTFLRHCCHEWHSFDAKYETFISLLLLLCHVRVARVRRRKAHQINLLEIQSCNAQ